jgi:hypothetical protein
MMGAHKKSGSDGLAAGRGVSHRGHNGDTGYIMRSVVKNSVR